VFRFAELFVLAIQQFRVAKDKKQWLSGTFRGLSEGMLRLPAVLQPGDLFRTLDAEKRYQLSSRA
jgi:hypothetical protein